MKPVYLKRSIQLAAVLSHACHKSSLKFQPQLGINCILYLFVTPVPRFLQLYWRCNQVDARSFNGEPPHSRFPSESAECGRLQRQMPLAHSDLLGLAYLLPFLSESLIQHILHMQW